MKRICPSQYLGHMDISTKIFRWVEILLLYIGIPLMYFFDFLPVHKLVPLIIVSLVYLYVILRDKSFKRHQLKLNGLKAWSMIFFRTSIIIVFLLVYVWKTFPEQLFQMPSERTSFWIVLLVLYPLWSVIPQEFVYRVYFYHRFSGLLKSRNLLVIINAVLFSFSHIIFENWVALIFTFVVSIMFSLTYLRYRSYSMIVLEHALYGSMIFTIGPGNFFYIP